MRELSLDFRNREYMIFLTHLKKGEGSHFKCIFLLCYSITSIFLNRHRCFFFLLSKCTSVVGPFKFYRKKSSSKGGKLGDDSGLCTLTKCRLTNCDKTWHRYHSNENKLLWLGADLDGNGSLKTFEFGHGWLWDL